MSDATAELIRRYDRSGPRYTSYPTAFEFHEVVDAEVYRRHLERAAAKDQPLSLYLHLPFCEERCLYCGCNVVITRKREVAGRYLDSLHTEIRRVAGLLGSRRRVRQYHWGGGTPTYLSPDEMRELQAVVASELTVEDDAEVAIEIDPRVTTDAHLEVIRELGFNRLSLGVQDFTPEVQECVHRIQSYEMTRELVDEARRLGLGSINVDLIYGLPKQSPETFQQTLDQVVAIRPARIAVYSYAHVPWLKVQQRRILEEQLPLPEVKIELIASAIRTFREAGYLAIGMDHFALPEDDLGQALEHGTLWRNFMGYTVRHAPDMVACGMSGIGDVAGGYFQNHRKLVRYQQAVDGGGLAASRGVLLTAEDQLRRHVITALMCAFRLDFGPVEERFGLAFREHFARELEELRTMEADGFLRLLPDRIEVLPLGRLFIRNVCMTFDAYLRRMHTDQPTFSRTV